MSANAGGENLGPLMADVALHLLGEPDDKKRSEWRWGNNGSMKVDLKTGTAYDFAAEKGGGVLWLIEQLTGRKGPDRLEWLVERGLLRSPDREGRRPNGHGTNGAGAAEAPFSYPVAPRPPPRPAVIRPAARAAG